MQGIKGDIGEKGMINVLIPCFEDLKLRPGKVDSLFLITTHIY